MTGSPTSKKPAENTYDESGAFPALVNPDLNPSLPVEVSIPRFHIPAFGNPVVKTVINSVRAFTNFVNFVNKLSNIMILLVVGINLPLEQKMDYLQKQKKKLIWMNNGLQGTKRVDYMAIC